eukprot:TRINITY_DN18911_c0_g2_i1.p1 TRINITY_DN18911_c0_g2~~TRINITY_DN18911_c0_g2_i1.p1  ORF type:complete len:563 (-),score=159.34 TRINITY_DN18911_c0_g2_i1:82-1716(-)
MWPCVAHAAPAALRRALSPAPARNAAALVVCRTIAKKERVNGVPSSVAFKRIYDAPTMDPDTVVQTLQAMVAEKSGDALLMEALSKRFMRHAEEFFPPQIDDALASFAELGYADDAMLRGFMGRIGDVMSDASPRRVVRILRNGTLLRLWPEEWLEHALPQTHRHLPNLREGVPACLASLHAVRWRDEEMAELLLTQGLIVAEELGDGFLARVLERWSRFGFRHKEAEAAAAKLASGDGVAAELDVRDCLNLLAALRRCGDKKLAAAADKLEQSLNERLKVSASAEVVDALLFMEVLALQSGQLWRTCADAVELALEETNFARDHLPPAVHALAALLPTGGGEKGLDATGLLLLGRLLGSAAVKKYLPRYKAPQLLQLVRAGGLASVLCEPGGETQSKLAGTVPWAEMIAPMSRLGCQLPLPGRRALWQTAVVLEDVGKSGGLGDKSESSTKLLVQSVGQEELLRLAPLPALVEDPLGSRERPDAQDVGAESLLVAGDKKGVKFLGHGDTFVTAKADSSPLLTPGCMLAARALELQGWQVEMRV